MKLHLQIVVFFAAAFFAALLCVAEEKSFPPVPKTDVTYKKVVISQKYYSEGASMADVNNDGHVDVICGTLWWHGPDFKKASSYAPAKEYLIKKYSDNFFTFPIHLTKDKWIDIFSVSHSGRGSQWIKNPGEKPLPADNKEHSCEHHPAQGNVCNESPMIVNILGSEKQFLLYSGRQLVISIPSDQDNWQYYPISPKDKRFHKYSHGLGAGDINGDGLVDIVERNGWWEQPKNWDKKSFWTFHSFLFSKQKGGAQMYVYDIDGDGDNDVVSALNAHAYGMAWFEQIKEDGKISFKPHVFMSDKPEGNRYGVCFSQPHAMECVDIDGDGLKDLVTGKCYFAHNGRDPGAKDPAVLYWFKTKRNADGTVDFIPYLIDSDSGVGRQVSCGDLNNDGKIDIVVGNKKGVFAFIQQ